MDVFLFLLYPRMRPHFETDLELAQRHLDAEDSVALITCDGFLTACDTNPEHSRIDCLKCIGRRRYGTGLLHGRFEELPLAKWASVATTEPVEAPATLHDLQTIVYGDFDLGDAVASTLVSWLRDPWPDLARHRAVVERLMRGTREVYDAARRLLDARRPGRVYVFNGRLASARAVLRACQSLGIDCRIHERGRDRAHFSLYANHMPHDIEAVADRIDRCWEGAADPPERRVEIARRWYLLRAAGEEVNWHSFTNRQVPEKLPATWQSRGRNLVLFTSSEDECAAVGGAWHAGPYADQISGLTAIAAAWNGRRDVPRLFVRVHPNAAALPAEYHRRLAALEGPSVSVIGPADEVDTYCLVRSADSVLTFNSTVGIEAVFWERPSILIGNSLYRRLGSTYQPATHDELIALMARSLEPQPVEPAIRYGYYWATLGEPYEHYSVDDLFRGRFRGRRVRVGLRGRLRVEWERRLARWMRRSA